MMRRTCLLLALLVLSPALQAADPATQIVVIRSTAGSLAPGKLIDVAETLSLSAGEQIVAVAANGQVIKVAGPYTGRIKVPAAPEKSGSILETISNLVRSESAEQNTLAVTRQWRVERPPSDPFAVDIALKGPHCVLEAHPVSIWRSVAGQESSIRLRRGSDTRSAASRWPAGANSAPWPDGIEIASGQTYRASIGGSREEAVFEIFVAPRTLPTTVHRAAWMAERGCRRQARMLLEKAASE